MLLQPKNWAVFQHYKDRCPPWIKLHRDLLNDRSYMRLPIASKALAPMLWLLASESKDGVFDGSSGAPATGTWAVGDELVYRTPTAGGYRGSVCTTAGTPGTWKEFGAIVP